jgi:hypothetical protein
MIGLGTRHKSFSVQGFTVAFSSKAMGISAPAGLGA